MFTPPNTSLPPARNIVIADPESFGNPTGATFRPRYVERNPPMWAVGETDMSSLSMFGFVANCAYAFGSFCLGFAANIFVSYAGVEKLTDVGYFMLHIGTKCTIFAAIVFFVFGGIVHYRKGSLWKQIKSETNQVIHK